MVGYVLEGLVAVLLLVTVGYCYVLDRQLRALRSGQDGLKAIIEGLDGATARAQASITDLRTAASGIGNDVSEQISRGRALADELAIMVDAGNALADRLEGNRGAKPQRTAPRVVAQTKPAPGDEPADDAENWEESLLKALREAR